MNPKNIDRYIIIFLFAVNFICGLLYINEGLFHFDSVWTAQAVERTYQTGILQPEVKGRYGTVLINSILYLPSYLLGQKSDFTVRFSSILFHSLSVIALFLFIKSLFDDNIQALFASLLLSFTPFYLSPNTLGKEHGLSIFALLSSLYLLVRGLNKSSVFLLISSSFMLAFAISTRESILPAAALFFIYLILPKVSLKPLRIDFMRDRFKPRVLASALLPFILLFCVIFFGYFKNVIHESSAKNYLTPYFLGILSPFLSLAIKDLFMGFLFPANLILFAFFLFGISKMLLDNKLTLWIFFSLWSLLIFFVGNVSTYLARYLDIVIIPVYVFTAYALSFLYRRSKIVSVLILIYLVLTMMIFMHPLLKFRHSYNGGKQFALYVKEKTPENAIIIATDDSPFIEYYGERKVISYAAGDRKSINNFVKDMGAYLRRGVPIYLIQSALNVDFGNILQGYLLENFNIFVVGEKLTEDYHRADLQFQLYNEKLFKIELKASDK